MPTPNIDLGRFGVFTWDPGSSSRDLGLAVTPEQAQEIDRLGYGTLWVTGSPAAELSFAEPLLESTAALTVATGIVNIWTAHAKTVAESFHRINTAHPGRFVLGIGAGHPEHTEQYRKPYHALVDYLDELDEYGVPANQRVLAALGPRVLRLAADRAAGAHPYNTTPEHTAQAREIIGPNALLAPEHKVLPVADAEEALAVGRKVLNTYNYLNLTNYVNNFKRLGFTDADLTPARQRQVHRRPGRLRHPRRHRQPPGRASAGRRQPCRDPSARWLGPAVADVDRAGRRAGAY
jgi:probable F420-dependent oxidoreductase